MYNYILIMVYFRCRYRKIQNVTYNVATVLSFFKVDIMRCSSYSWIVFEAQFAIVAQRSV